MQINAIIGLLLAIFMLHLLRNVVFSERDDDFLSLRCRSETISEQIQSNGQVVHQITTEYVVIRNDEPWDVREAGR